VLIYSTRPVEVTAALKTVSHYRLDRDLSFRKLAHEMTDAGCPMNTRTLIDLFQWAAAKDAGEAWARHRPRDRTKYHLVKFHAHLKARREQRRAAAHRRRASSSLAPALAADAKA
jgi:hypothetical protein